MKYFISALLIVGAAAAGYFVYQEKFSPGHALTIACEEELKLRLKAPATYSRVESRTLLVEATTIDDVISSLGYDDLSSRSAEVRRWNEAIITMTRAKYSNSTPYKHQLVITYDAANAFGTPIRGMSLCVTFSHKREDLSESDFVSSSLLIDGKKYTDWLIDRIR